MNLVESLKDKLGMTKKPSPEAKRVIQRIDVLMQRFEPWRLNEAEAKELNRLLAQQAENQWYFKARDVYAPSPVPRNLYKKSASGGGAKTALGTREMRRLYAVEGHAGSWRIRRKDDPNHPLQRTLSFKTEKAAWDRIRAFESERQAMRRSGSGAHGGGGAKTRASRGAVARYVDPHETPGERASFNRWFGNKYGLSPVELDALHKCHRIDRLEQELDAWRQAHGWLTTNSPLARGKLMDLVRSGKFT